MDKQDFDQLYHILRKAHQNRNEEELAAIDNLSTYLIQSNGSYTNLVKYLDYYGRKYVLPQVIDLIKSTDFHPRAIVEIGAGTGWLSKGLGKAFKATPVPTDKRPWTTTTIVIDVETEIGLVNFFSLLDEYPDPLIVMCDVLHCLENGKELLSKLECFNVFIAEYIPASTQMRQSYIDQLALKGAKAFTSPKELHSLGREDSLIHHFDPYIFMASGPYTINKKEEIDTTCLK